MRAIAGRMGARRDGHRKSAHEELFRFHYHGSCHITPRTAGRVERACYDFGADEMRWRGGCGKRQIRFAVMRLDGAISFLAI